VFVSETDCTASSAGHQPRKQSTVVTLLIKVRKQLPGLAHAGERRHIRLGDRVGKLS
jgi:hypothetical protein